MTSSAYVVDGTLENNLVLNGVTLYWVSTHGTAQYYRNQAQEEPRRGWKMTELSFDDASPAKPAMISLNQHPLTQSSQMPASPLSPPYPPTRSPPTSPSSPLPPSKAQCTMHSNNYKSLPGAPTKHKDKYHQLQFIYLPYP